MCLVTDKRVLRRGQRRRRRVQEPEPLLRGATQLDRPAGRAGPGGVFRNEDQEQEGLLDQRLRLAPAQMHQ